MTWLPYGISAVLLLLVLFEYRLKYIDKDGRTIDHKQTRRIVLTIAIISIVAQSVVAGIKDRKASKDSAVLRGKVDLANTNIGKLTTQQSELLAALSTNNAIDPKLRVAILEHSHAVELVSADVSDLEQWKTDVKNERATAKQNEQAGRLKHEIIVAEQKEAAQQRIEVAWKQAGPLYDFILRTLQANVQKIAKEKGDKILSNYSGLPQAPRLGVNTTEVAKIVTGTNLAWSFEASAEGIPRGNGAEVWLRVWASCSNQAARVLYQTRVSWDGSSNTGMTPLNAESFLWVEPKTSSDFVQAFELANFQTNTVVWVRRFLGTHAIKCDQ